VRWLTAARSAEREGSAGRWRRTYLEDLLDVRNVHAEARLAHHLDARAGPRDKDELGALAQFVVADGEADVAVASLVGVRQRRQAAQRSGTAARGPARRAACTAWLVRHVRSLSAPPRRSHPDRRCRWPRRRPCSRCRSRTRAGACQHRGATGGGACAEREPSCGDAPDALSLRSLGGGTHQLVSVLSLRTSRYASAIARSETSAMVVASKAGHGPEGESRAARSGGPRGRQGA